jgi:hypothetical protein
MFISTILLIVSTTVLALNISTTGRKPSPQVLIAPVQIPISGREQVYNDMVRFFLRDLNEKPPAPVAWTPPTPPQTRGWPTLSSKMAIQLSSLMPIVIVCGTLLAIVSDVLETTGVHLLPIIVTVACPGARIISRSGLRAGLVHIAGESVYVVWITLATLWCQLNDLLSSLIHCIESGITVSHVLPSYHIC